MSPVAPAGHRRDGLLLAAAVGVIGMTFGVLADAAGFSTWQIIAMSMFVFTGASQFAAVSVIDAGGSAFAAVGSAMLLAARNGLYGPVMHPYLHGSVARRAASAHLLIDETTGMAVAQPDPADRADAFHFTGIWLWLFWNLGSVAGAGLGDLLGDPEVYGLDAAFPASFVALLWPHLRGSAGRIVAAVGATLALVAIPLLPAGGPLLVAAAGPSCGT